MPLEPYSGPFGTPQLRHLLRRSLFGCSNGDLAHFNGTTMEAVVQELLTFTNDTTPPIKTYWGLNGTTPDPALLDPNVPFGSTWVTTLRDFTNDDITSNRIANFAWWRVGLMTHQDRNLREKLSLFWFNHMPNQAGDVFVPELLYDYDQLLRTHCKGNFRELMYEVSTSGAMLIYLNGYLNTATAPDENFAREVMELFTLGEGSGYSEQDVQTAARVLTGWSLRLQDSGQPIIPETTFYEVNHDTTNKTFSGFFNNTVIQGQSGPTAGATELNAFLDMVFAKEEVSLFICRELYRFFVHGEITAVVEADVIVPLADIFRANSGAPDQIRTVMHALLTSAHFYSVEVLCCMVKSPVDLVVGTVRMLDMPFPTPAQFEARYSAWRDVYYLIAFSGQQLLSPPNVAGWPAYYQYPQYDNLWMDTATFQARNFSMLGILYNGFTTDANMYQPESRDLVNKVDLMAVLAQFTDASDPNNAIAESADLLYCLPISQTVKDQLKTNFLLLGQSNDLYWTDAYDIYAADPNTTNMTAQLVPAILLWLYGEMVQAAEIHIH